MKYAPLIAGVILLFAYEAYALRSQVRGDTISEIVWTWSERSTLLPFAFGLLCGHLFWPRN